MPLNNENDASKIKIRRDTAQNWAELNPILDEGEIGIEWTDNTKTVCNIKIGNGVDHFNDLNYFKGSLYEGEISPLISYDELNDLTLPTINGVTLTGDLSLTTLGIQPIGNYASGEVLVQGLALKADKDDTYDKDEVDNLIDNIRQLPDYSEENGTYLKIINGVPVYSTIDADVVSRATLDEELSKKVDKANGYSLVKDTEHQAMLDAIETFESYDVPDVKEDVALLQTEMDTKADVETLDNYLPRSEFIGALDNYATLADLRTKANASELTSHTQDFTNPHRVSLSQLGLSDNYALYPDPLLLPINTATQSALNDKQDSFQTGYGLDLSNGVLENSLPNIQSDWLAVEGESEAAILNKPVFADVALSGSYNDLSDKPEIEHYVLPEAQAEELGGIKLGEDFELDENGHLKYISGIVDYNDLRNKPSFIVDGNDYPLIQGMIPSDLNLASLSVAKAIDTRLQEEKADKTEIARLDERIDNIPQLDNVYTKAECDALFLKEHQDISGKADWGTTLAEYHIDNAYTKTEVNNRLADKANASTVDAKQDKANIAQDITAVTSELKSTMYPSVAAIEANNTTLESDYNGKIDTVDDRVDATNLNLSTNYYTSSQVDTLIQDNIKFKGSIVHYEDLPLAPETGDLYQVDYKYNTTTSSDEVFNNSVVWDGADWIKLIELETQVVDVKVGTTSVVTNNIATLGTMAGENTTSYYTKTQVDDKFQYVTQLPQNPVAGVTYFILES